MFDANKNMIVIEVTDEIEPLLERMASQNPKNIKAVAKSWGWFQQKEIKKGVKSGSPGGATFKERRPHEVRAALQGGSAAKQWYGRMVRAIGYQYDNGAVNVGWTSKTASIYGHKQEFGNVTKVTDEIRKKFGEAGYPLRKDTTHIILPERPVFEPMSGELYSQLAPYVEEKYNQYLTGDVNFAKKARRKYKVYG